MRILFPRSFNYQVLRTIRCRSLGNFGPPPPPIPDIDPDGKGAYEISDDGKPMWLKCAPPESELCYQLSCSILHRACRDLERDVDYDPDVKELLDGTNGDPNLIRMRMSEYVDRKDAPLIAPKLGSEQKLHVMFREFDPGSIYVS
jgi:hypothetical protein